jgi:hypothetical protein
MKDMFKVNKQIPIVWLIPFMLNWSCHHSPKEEASSARDPDNHVVVKRRADGSISSINQVDNLNRVHGTRVTYYADGKTVYSKTTFEHGIKNGPFERYYRNGQIFEHTPYKDGNADGLTRKFYMNGDLMAEFHSENGVILPGLKEYARDGTLITDYPEIKFRKIDHLEERNRVDLQIFPEPTVYPVKYYRTASGTEHKERVYLISERGRAALQFYVQPGELLEEEIEITAEFPTELGNTLVRYATYTLRVHHTP